MADPVELLVNRDFSAGYVRKSNPGTGWKMIPASLVDGIDSNSGGKLTFWSQSDAATKNGGAVVGPINPDYRPYPNATLTATAKITAYNYDAKLRIQIGDTPYPISATPSSEPKILAEVTVPGASGEKTVTVDATVPATYDGSEPIYFAAYTNNYRSGNIANASVFTPSLLQTDPGTVPAEPDPDPDPDPGDGGSEPPEPVSDAAQRVADFLGAGDDPTLVALAGESVAVITAMARAYTRGNGFSGTEPNDEIAAVITAASARLVANPEQLEQDVGTVWTRSSFVGWSLAEQFVLNRYRVRAQ